MLESTFQKFIEAFEKFSSELSERSSQQCSDHFRCRYVEIYEQDVNCGTHLFQLKVCVGDMVEVVIRWVVEVVMWWIVEVVMWWMV